MLYYLRFFLVCKIIVDIRQNLGILICLDKDQANLPELLEKYPFLYNMSQLIWLEEWSEETLKDMPTLVIQRYSTLYALRTIFSVK